MSFGSENIATPRSGCASCYLQTHGWDPGKQESDSKASSLERFLGQPIDETSRSSGEFPKAKQLAIDNGFSYQNYLGELIYAYVIGRLDIGYAVCFLARFSESPHEEQYKALKQVCDYLRATKLWPAGGIGRELIDWLIVFIEEWVTLAIVSGWYGTGTDCTV